MPIPAGVETVTLTDGGVPVTAPDGTVLEGYLTVTGPDLATVREDDFVFGGSARRPVVAGRFDPLVLVATDATGLDPTGGTYTVVFTARWGVTWTRYISLPQAVPTVKLADVLMPDPVANTFATLVDASQLTSGPVLTVEEFLASTPFAVAHRGSGGEFPEHTMAAYGGALAAGARAVEVSLNLTGDGVPVCIHDTTLDRTTDHTGAVINWPYAALREGVRVTQQGLLGAGWSNQPIPTMEEAMDLLYGRCVVFLEPKSSPTVQPMLSLLALRYPSAPSCVVYKGYYTDGNFAAVRALGYKVWAYVDAGTTDGQMDAVDANVDIWGVPIGTSDSRISQIVARGKPVMVWEVHRHSEVDRLIALGVQGLMESEWIYLNKQPEMDSGDTALTARVSMPGTLGAQGYSANYALQYDGSGGAYLNQVSGYSVLMGGMRAEDGTAYTLGFSMKWDTLPGATLHSGIAFGKVSDDTYQFSAANPSGGYHMLIRGNGDMQIYRHTAGVTTGTQLGTIATAAPVAGTYMNFTLQVTPTQIIATRTDTGTVLTVTDSTYRGRYWHLTNGSITSLTNKPTWRSLSAN